MGSVDDPVIAYIRRAAEAEPAILRIILFGSRARGNGHERSDYDVAVEAPALSDAAWARWALELQEGVPTLCGLDLVRIDTSASRELQEAIRKEGVAIYERNANREP